MLNRSLALEQLNSLKQAPSQIGINAREAVRFLDRVTSGKDSIPDDKVVLQGPMEQHESWADTEQYLLPEYVDEFREESKEDEVENSALALSQKLLDKLNFKKDVEAGSTNSAESPISIHVSVVSSATQSSKTSPEVTAAKLSDANKVFGDTCVNGNVSGSSSTPKDTRSSTSVPLALQSLLNAILWRLHNNVDTSDSMANCILISNDATTQGWAQKFGITVKNVNKLRQSIIYEDKEYKNRAKYFEKVQPENSSTPEPGPTFKYEDSDEEVVVFTPRGRGTRGATRGARGRRPTGLPRASAPKPEIPSQPIDPDSFSRTPGVTKYPKDETVSTPAPRENFHPRAFRGGFRGAPRGRGRLWMP
jgi:hypothetical protein